MSTAFEEEEAMHGGKEGRAGAEGEKRARNNRGREAAGVVGREGQK